MEWTDPKQLTPSQQTIIERAADSRCLVFGEAGSGKTHVLIQRIAKLLSVDALAPGREILLLTFGRETAAELRRRAVRAGGDVAYVRASTFDSFATSLLDSISPEGNWTGRSYDGRIEAATELICSDERAQRYLSRLKHVIVDEIQDLVGVRARFVLSLLGFTESGFTLLGDPAQAIYNFQLAGTKNEIGSDQLLDLVRGMFPGLETFALRDSFRALSDETRSPLQFGPMLAESDADYEYIRRELETILLRSDPAPLKFLGKPEGTTAVLCHTNAQALMVSKELFDKGVDHEYRRSLADRLIPPWIGRVLGPVGAQQLSKAGLSELLTGVPGEPCVDDAWRVLRAMDPNPGRTIQIQHIAQSIRLGRGADEPPRLGSRVTISTIHRAKGLEFDRVVVVKPSLTEYEGRRSAADDARVLYVALTRPREGIYSLDPPDVRGWRKARLSRSARRTFIPPGGTHIQGIEVVGGDVRSDVPAGFVAEASGTSSAETQRYIQESVHTGDSVLLLLNEAAHALEKRLGYLIVHSQIVVGETSEAFGDSLSQAGLLRRGGKPVPPSRIEGLRVEAVDTVAGTVAAAERAGLQGVGIWNRVRVFGLGELVYPSPGDKLMAKFLSRALGSPVTLVDGNAPVEVERALESLREREAGVLKLRFGLEDGKERTLREVGAAMGISAERVRQVEKRALRKLRHPVRSAGLRDLVALSGPIVYGSVGKSYGARHSVAGGNLQIAKARESHPRAYEQWTRDEDLHLKDLFESRKSIREIASILKRKPSAIRARLKRSGIDPYGDRRAL